MSKHDRIDEVDEHDTDMVDPDVRFLLANERTLLAWVRTALALIAGGLALCALGQRSVVDVGFGVVAILLGAVMATTGYARYQNADRAIRRLELPDRGRAPGWQVVGVVGFALVVAIVELARFR